MTYRERELMEALNTESLNVEEVIKTASMKHQTTIPGLKAQHAVITPNCRKAGDAQAIDDALIRIRKAFMDMTVPANDEAEFHIAITVQRPETDGEK